MSAHIHFLAFDQVIVIHQRMTEEFGGDASIRDQGLLESAVTMPSQQFSGDYLHKGIPTMAAAYLFHICKNHAFIDGNKRTALASAEMFILLNDMTLDATNKELEILTLGVADGSVTKPELIDFFVAHVKEN